MVVRNKILFSWIIIVQFFFTSNHFCFELSPKESWMTTVTILAYPWFSLIFHHQNDISNINVQFFYEIFWLLRAVNGPTILNGELLFQFNFFCIVHV